MPLYHCSIKALNRRRIRTAVAAIAYRAGGKIRDAEKLNDYSKKQGVLHTEIMLPDGAPGWAKDRENLWNAVDVAERKSNSRLIREYELALPAEISYNERLKLAREFTRYIVEKYGVAADMFLHDQRHGNKNFHVHIATSTRVLTPEGFGKKTRILDDKKSGPIQIKMIRKEWEKMLNHALEVNRIAERVSSDSLNRQGIQREPTTHLGPNVLGILERQERLKVMGAEDEKLVASTVADRVLEQIEEHRKWNGLRLQAAETIKAEHDRMYEEFMNEVSALDARPESKAPSIKVDAPVTPPSSSPEAKEDMTAPLETTAPIRAAAPEPSEPEEDFVTASLLQFEEICKNLAALEPMPAFSPEPPQIAPTELQKPIEIEPTSELAAQPPEMTWDEVWEIWQTMNEPEPRITENEAWEIIEEATYKVFNYWMRELKNQGIEVTKEQLKEVEDRAKYRVDNDLNYQKYWDIIDEARERRRRLRLLAETENKVENEVNIDDEFITITYLDYPAGEIEETQEEEYLEEVQEWDEPIL